ncbi:HAD family hydrolase [Denitrobaculum tricleocarpae]|uniref:HAD family hydrolase n=1 Tax=Denitrobaculum tricleocarpae TaxID=2591009 RepID=A0A545TY58_9PROT|nr:HAD family hydrolase [Denitrobaculum tricleocarpae]TQV82152.1 HAD family hydrolase [Denitrobaculum tricleocarpae]
MADTPAGNLQSAQLQTRERPRLVIFDCDGVLVDSEPLSFQVLSQNIALKGASIPMEDCYRLFLGKSLTTTTEILSREFNVEFSDADLDSMRIQLFSLYRRELRPIPGIAALMQNLDLPVCVASSSQLERIRLSLEVTGLRANFEPNIFSATMVANGKPAPDLFLHAAQEMGVNPRHCLVIEDSPAGIEAAQRAGMTVVGFTGGGHAQTDSHRLSLEALSPKAVIAKISELSPFL